MYGKNSVDSGWEIVHNLRNHGPKLYMICVFYVQYIKTLAMLDAVLEHFVFQEKKNDINCSWQSCRLYAQKCRLAQVKSLVRPH